MKSLLSLLLFLSLPVFAQQRTIFKIDSLPANGILLDKGWKFHVGDNPDWANADFDDSAWESIDPTMDIMSLPKILQDGKIGWFRLNFLLAEVPSQPLSIMLQQSGASEIYLNGKLIARYGKLSNNVVAYDPLNNPIYLPSDSAGQFCLTVRYTLQPNIHYTQVFGNIKNEVFLATLIPLKQAIDVNRQYTIRYTNLESYKLGLFFILFILHLSFYLFYRVQKVHLFVAIAFLSLGLHYSFKLLADLENLVEERHFYYIVSYIFSELTPFLTLNVLYLFLNQRRRFIFWSLAFLTFIFCVLSFRLFDGGIPGFILTIMIAIEQIRVVWRGIRAKVKGAWVLAIGVAINIFFFIFLFSIIGYFMSVSPVLADIVFNTALLAFPVSLSVFLGVTSAYTNRELTKKLIENETLSAEKQQILATQNETLEKQVTERTAELSHKNHELIVEASLEKVRSRTMAMQNSNEVMDVAITLYEELQNLDFRFGACTIIIMDKVTGDMEHWVAGFTHKQYPQSFHISYFKNPCHDAQLAAWKNGDSYLIYKLEGEEKNIYDEEMFTKTGYQAFPEEEKKWMRENESVTFSLAFMAHGALHWGPGLLSEEQAIILQRFAKVFEQAYTRFLDLKQAEAQAQEAQIEVALERVRSRTMAMHKSEELREVVAAIYEQLQKLGFTYGALAIVIMDELTGDSDWWMAGFGKDNYPEKYRIPFNNHPFYLAQLDAWKEGKKYVEVEVSGEAKRLYDEFVFSQTDFVHIPEESKKIMSGFKKLIFSNAGMKHGVLSWGTTPIKSEHVKVLQRFAIVFEQTYTRFLDLQKAEAQARESQIEASFERIRASALAMQTSDEFLGVVRTLYEQINTLGQQELEATTIQFYDIKAGFINSWHAQNIDKITADNISLGTTRIPFDACELTLEWIDAYKSTKEDYTIVAKGEKLKEWLRFLVKISPEIKDRLGDSMPEISNFHFSEFSEGALSMVSQKPFSEESKYLLKRAASAFDLAYKRYLDLQLKEEQTLKLSHEKQRLEAALKELQATQNQLIQKEKLASLGELTAGIAHEIQNPLNFVNNFSEMSIELAQELKEEAEKPIFDKELIIDLANDLTQNQQKISHHGKRASSIVSGMLEHSRTSTGERAMTDINKLADEYLRLSYHGMRAKYKDFNSDYEFIADENLPLINVVPQDIGRVLLNLINNAFYAVSQPNLQGFKNLTGLSDAKVIVKTDYSDTQLIIKVIDNGTGMSKEVQAKIFQPFFTTKPTGEGTGLGLSLAYDIVTKGHGGTIECESVEGEGTMFVVRLPLEIS